MNERVLTADLVSKNNREIALALAIAPEGVDIARSPIASKILYEDNNPERWLLICRLARHGKESISEGRRLALMLEEVRGLRNTHLWNVPEVEGLLDDAKKGIESLQRGEENKRLQELHVYEGAMVFHACGKYTRAAECHDAARELATTPLGAGIARFMAANERLNEQLFLGAGERIPEEFDESSRSLMKTVDRATPEGLRWYTNALCFRIRGYWLCGISDYFSEQVIRRRGIRRGGMDLPRELRPAFDDAFGFIYALSSSNTGLWIARRLGGDPRTAVDWRADALLLTAQIELGIDDIQGSRETLQSLIALEGNGGHVARAMARRMISLLS